MPNLGKRISVGLVHYPVYDKTGTVVCTNVTNLDVHDIARACRTYGVSQYFVINPMKEQVIFVGRMLEFWRTGTGSDYNPMRKTALTMVRPAHSIDEVIANCPSPLEIITTSAKERDGIPNINFQSLREEIAKDQRNYLLLFGTGFGMEESVFKGTRLLEAIKGASPEDYRHLSVRSAVSICLDRLLGPCYSTSHE